jgi:hypothetical protein
MDRRLLWAGIILSGVAFGGQVGNRHGAAALRGVIAAGYATEIHRVIA